MPRQSPYWNDERCLLYTSITEGDATAWDSTKTWGVLPAELNVQKGETLFPRIDMKKELAELEAAIKASQATSVANQQKKEEKKAEAESEYPAEITIDDFCKVQLKVDVYKRQSCSWAKKSMSFSSGSATSKGATVLSMSNTSPRMPISFSSAKGRS